VQDHQRTSASLVFPHLSQIHLQQSALVFVIDIYVSTGVCIPIEEIHIEDTIVVASAFQERIAFNQMENASSTSASSAALPSDLPQPALEIDVDCEPPCIPKRRRLLRTCALTLVLDLHVEHIFYVLKSWRHISL